MSILFSAVEVTAGGYETELLVGGIPRSREDIEGWSAFDDLMESLDEESDVHVHAEAYLYGEGEAVHADPAEVAYMMLRMKADDNFLTGHCDNIEDVDFSFTEIPEDFSEEQEM